MTTPGKKETDTEEKLVGSYQPATTAQRAIPLLVAAVVVVVDHFTKLVVEAWLPLNHTWAPFPDLAHLFRITHVSNTGAAFGFFPGGSSIFTVIAVVVALVIVVYNFGLPQGNRILRVALGLQVGGALGNLIDRLRLGHVTDFFDFGPWPVFNVADMSIVGGVILLGLLMIREQRQLAADARADDGQMDEEQSALGRYSTQRQNEQAT